MAGPFHVRMSGWRYASAARRHHDQWRGCPIEPAPTSTVMLPEILTSVSPILNWPLPLPGNASSGSGSGAGCEARERYKGDHMVHSGRMSVDHPRIIVACRRGDQTGIVKSSKAGRKPALALCRLFSRVEDMVDDAPGLGLAGGHEVVAVQ